MAEAVATATSRSPVWASDWRAGTDGEMSRVVLLSGLQSDPSGSEQGHVFLQRRAGDTELASVRLASVLNPSGGSAGAGRHSSRLNRTAAFLAWAEDLLARTGMHRGLLDVPPSYWMRLVPEWNLHRLDRARCLAILHHGRPEHETIVWQLNASEANPICVLFHGSGKRRAAQVVAVNPRGRVIALSGLRGTVLLEVFGARSRSRLLQVFSELERSLGSPALRDFLLALPSGRWLRLEADLELRSFNPQLVSLQLLEGPNAMVRRVMEVD